MARCLKTLSDPNRIRILHILVQGEFCVSDLVERLQVDQPKVSHHLAILRSAGIIRCRRDGRHINYSLLPAVHQRREAAPADGGPVHEFNLGDLSVSFRFVGDELATDGAERTGAGATRIRLVDVQVAARSAGGDTAPATGSASAAD